MAPALKQAGAEARKVPQVKLFLEKVDAFTVRTRCGLSTLHCLTLMSAVRAGYTSSSNCVVCFNFLQYLVVVAVTVVCGRL